jgi:hypothetical protein
MKNKLVFAALAAALSATAFAGARYGGPTFIAGNQATGNLGDARSSNNDRELIGCSKYGWSGTTGPGYVFCWAVTAEGDQLTCSSENNQAMINATAAIGTASLIMFFANKDGTCASIDVQNYSGYTPMVP